MRGRTAAAVLIHVCIALNLLSNETHIVFVAVLSEPTCYFSLNMNLRHSV